MWLGTVHRWIVRRPGNALLGLALLLASCTGPAEQAAGPFAPPDRPAGAALQKSAAPQVDVAPLAAVHKANPGDPAATLAYARALLKISGESFAGGRASGIDFGVIERLSDELKDVAATGVQLEPGYVQLVDGAPGVLSALPLPQLYSGPSFAYALQWLAFGAALSLRIFLPQLTAPVFASRQRSSPVAPSA